MKIHILTLFPDLFEPFFSSSLIGKACDQGIIEYTVTNLRDYAEPPHYHVDDTPYGGGPGMVLKPEPLARALEEAKKVLPNARIIFPSPRGVPFSQSTAGSVSTHQELIFLCGRYEGIDERIIDQYVDEEISLGDYVLMGGELPTMVILEASVRLMEGVVGNKASLEVESFSPEAKNLLEAPQYTRPAIFNEHSVPEILLSGDHEKIEQWRKDRSYEITREKRPDLLDKGKHDS